jgi:putative tryptophan/tyrosine transport system substrate-binding protein
MQRRTFLGGSIAILAGPLCTTAGFTEQPTRLPVIGVLGGGSSGAFAPFIAAFRDGLSDTGYVERNNLAIEYAGRRAAMIACRHLLPTLSAAKSM